MCRGIADFELSFAVPDVQLVQMWVCDLVMSRSLYFGNLLNIRFYHVFAIWL